MMSKVELSTNLVPFFTGTYYNYFWELREYNEDGDEMEVNYKFEELMASIIRAYQDEQPQIESDIKRVAPFVKSLTFTGESYSPPYYNFKTDTIYFDVEYDHDELMQFVAKMEDDEKWEKFLAEHYTSRDGFWSYTPNSHNGIVFHLTDGSDKLSQSFGALLRYLIGEKELNEMEYAVSDSWSGNGYCGLDYEIVEQQSADSTQSESTVKSESEPQ